MIRFARLLLLVGILAFTGCHEDGINVYGVPKEPARGHPPMGSAAEVKRATPSGNELGWNVPAGWSTRPASGMRKASLVIPGPGGEPAELSVVVLPGAAGGKLANINRWRGQLGLAPLDADALAACSVPVECAAGTILVVDFTGRTGDQPARLVGGVLRLSEASWFFKATGAPGVLGAAKPSILRFLRSVHLVRP